MADEQVEVVAVPDHKRKLEGLEAEAEREVDAIEGDGATEVDGSEAKRARLDEENVKPDGSATANGTKEENEVKEEEDDDVEEDPEEPEEEVIVTTTNEVQETAEVKTEGVSSVDEHVSGDDQQISVTEETKEVLISKETEDGIVVVKEETKEVTVTEGEKVEPSEEEPLQETGNATEDDEQSPDDSTVVSRRMEVPNNKVGVLIGKAGDTIRYLQFNSGAKIQITRDADSDPNSMTRPVEIVGTLRSIKKAEKLISAVIAEAEAGGSPSLVARGLATAPSVGIGEQVEIKVPNEKVGLIIGRGGETIKSLQTRSGARIQLIPQHLPEGDGSKERTVRVTGDMRQIEMAQEMIKEVLIQNVRPSPHSGGFNHQAYRPRGPSGPPQWGPRGPGYDYQHRGHYPSHQNPQYPHPPYGGYPPQQMGPRSHYGGPPSMQGHPPSGGYDYYGGQGGHASDHHPAPAPHSAPIPGHGTGPSPAPTGPPPSQSNYNYGPPHGQDYGHHQPYAQSGPQHSYGHGYEDGKYDNHAPMQNPYGGHGNPQHYPQGSQQGYPQMQPYGKPPSYGMPPQGPPQSYGPPRTSQPGDVPYQSSVPPAQSYGQPVAPQQQYQYPSSGAMQQTYPSYGAAPATDGYSQQPPSSAPYAQQGVQSTAGYTQPGGQQVAGYGHVGPTSAYGGYSNPQQGYTDQSATNTAGYGYQGPQDPNYASGPGSTYAAAAPTAQVGYAQPQPGQPAAAQPNYDQSAQQSTAYGVAPGSAPVAYNKTVSPQPQPQPQPGYPQYDSSQMYATAPR